MTDGRKVPHHEDLSGKTFERWKVLHKVPKNHEKYNKHALYLCQCACGSAPKIVTAISLRSGTSRSCGCIRIESVSKKPFESLYNRIVSHNVGVQVDLSYEEYLDFTTISTCHYCGVTVQWESSSRKSSGYKLDRKDNNLGYSKENCVVCCGDCNRTKGDRFTYAEFMLLSPALNQIRKGRSEE